MATVKRNGNSIILKNGKVSCDCCAPSVVCSYYEGLNTAWVLVELTPAQFALLYAGGTTSVGASAAINVGITSGCTRQELTATGTMAPHTASNLPALGPNSCEYRTFATDQGLTSSNCSCVGTVVSTPCTRVLTNSSCSLGSTSASSWLFLWNSGSIQSYPVGMAASFNIEMAASGTNVWSGSLTHTISGTARLSTIRGTPSAQPSNGASNWNTTGTVSLVTDAGTIAIPVYNRSTYGANYSTRSNIVTDIYFSSMPVYTFSPLAP